MMEFGPERLPSRPSGGRARSWARGRRLAAAVLLLGWGSLFLATPLSAQNILYWQCVAPSAANPQGTYCPTSMTYPLPVQNQGQSTVAITPANGTTFAATRAIFNGNATACNINMKLKNDTAAVIWKNVQAGATLPIQVIDIESTNTTCSDILAVY